MIPEKNKIFTNAEMLDRLQTSANASAKDILNNLGINESNPEYLEIKYQLGYDIYNSLKKNLKIKSEY